MATANTLNTSLSLAPTAARGEALRYARLGRSSECGHLHRVRNQPFTIGGSAHSNWGVTTWGACAFTRSLTRTYHFEMHRSVRLEDVGKRHTIGSTMTRRSFLCRFGCGLLVYMLIGSFKKSFCSSATHLRLVHINFQGEAKPILGCLT